MMNRSASGRYSGAASKIRAEVLAWISVLPAFSYAPVFHCAKARQINSTALSLSRKLIFSPSFNPENRLMPQVSTSCAEA